MSMINGTVMMMAAENIATKHGKPYSRDVAQSVQLAASKKPAEGNASRSDQSDDHASRGGVEADIASLGGGNESGPTPDQATSPKSPAGPLAAESEKGTEADQSALTGTAPGSAPAPAGAAPFPNIPAARSMGMGSGETTSSGPTAAVATDRAQGSGSRAAEPQAVEPQAPQPVEGPAAASSLASSSEPAAIEALANLGSRATTEAAPAAAPPGVASPSSSPAAVPSDEEPKAANLNTCPPAGQGSLEIASGTGMVAQITAGFRDTRDQNMCLVAGCKRRSRGSTSKCFFHGGGKRCRYPGCSKGARGRCGLCVGHGGGRRCAWRGHDGNGPPCSKGAQGRTPFCMAHGGGRRCSVPGCRKGSAGPPKHVCKAHTVLAEKGVKLSHRSPKRARKGGSGSSAPAKRRRRSAAPGSQPAAPPALPASAAERLQLLMGGHDYLGRDRLASASASVLTDLLPLGAGAQSVAGSLMPPHMGISRSMGAGYPPGLTPKLQSLRALTQHGYTAQLAAGHSTGLSRAAGVSDPYAAASMGRGLTPAAALGAHALGPFGGSMLQPGANASTGGGVFMPAYAAPGSFVVPPPTPAAMEYAAMQHLQQRLHQSINQDNYNRYLQLIELQKMWAQLQQFQEKTSADKPRSDSAVSHPRPAGYAATQSSITQKNEAARKLD